MEERTTQRNNPSAFPASFPQTNNHTTQTTTVSICPPIGIPGHRCWGFVGRLAVRHLSARCRPCFLVRSAFARAWLFRISPSSSPPPLRARAPFSPSSSSPSYSELRPMISSGVTLHPALLFVKRHTRTRRDTDQQQRHLGVLAVLAAIWDRLGVLLGGSFGTSWAVLGPSWRPFGRSWGHLGSLLCRFGPSEGRKGANAKILQKLMENQ